MVAYPSIHSISEPAWRFLRGVGRRCNVTNMPLENLLSQMKASVGCGRRAPTVEKLAYITELSALMHDHIARDFKNHVVQS
eukprot:3069204-Lingulodinium_polyedra.AAC.1